MGILWRMLYICNDCTTALTGLQSIPIFASFPRTKRVLCLSISSIIPLLQGVKLPLSCMQGLAKVVKGAMWDKGKCLGDICPCSDF